MDFISIGAQKAGTTYLYQYLNQHPQVFMPTKEIHFWDFFNDFSRPDIAIKWYKAIYQGRSGCRGDITPAYSILPSKIVAHVHEAAPDAKIIFAMRNPVERMYSAALMNFRMFHNVTDFGAVTDEEFFKMFSAESMTLRGDYERTVRNWRVYYPDDQILLLEFEFLQRNPRGFLTVVADFIGIDASFFEEISDQTLHKKIGAGVGHPMRPTICKFLHEMYDDKIDSLSTYLKRDLSQWKEPKHR